MVENIKLRCLQVKKNEKLSLEKLTMKRLRLTDL